MVTVKPDGTLLVFGERLSRGDSEELFKSMGRALGHGAAVDAIEELEKARKGYPTPFNSAHEGFSIMNEEVDELWDEVRAKQGGDRDPDSMRKEAVQVAAMAMRFIDDVVDGGREQV